MSNVAVVNAVQGSLCMAWNLRSMFRNQMVSGLGIRNVYQSVDGRFWLVHDGDFWLVNPKKPVEHLQPLSLVSDGEPIGLNVAKRPEFN